MFEVQCSRDALHLSGKRWPGRARPARHVRPSRSQHGAQRGPVAARTGRAVPSHWRRRGFDRLPIEETGDEGLLMFPDQFDVGRNAYTGPGLETDVVARQGEPHTGLVESGE